MSSRPLGAGAQIDCAAVAGMQCLQYSTTSVRPCSSFGSPGSDCCCCWMLVFLHLCTVPLEAALLFCALQGAR